MQKIIKLYSRPEVAALLNPPVSVNTIRRMENDGRMPKHVKKNKDNGFFYSKNEIDEWLLTNPKTKNKGRKYSGGKGAITCPENDVWNIKNKKEPIIYDEKMIELIMFLQPNLRYKNVGNAQGA